MKRKNVINKIKIVIFVIFIIGMIFSNYSQAIGDVFSDADNFVLERRTKCIKNYK